MALLGGAAIQPVSAQRRPSPLIDTSVWNLTNPDLAGRFRRMREAITGPPEEARARWKRMRQRTPSSSTSGSGTGSTNQPGSANFFQNFPDPVAESSLLQPVLDQVWGRSHDRTAGDGSFGSIRRQTGTGAVSRLTPRPETPGGTAGGTPAGDSGRYEVGMIDLTRWERAKEVLRRLGTSYVEQDIQGFMRQFSANATLDLSILRRAVNTDFEQEADIQLDFELIEYRLTFDTIMVRLRWLRSSVLENGTPSRVNLGESRLLFDRFDDMRIKTWTGLPPFGARDPQLLAQTKAGNPNDEDSNNNNDGFGEPDPDTDSGTTDPPGRSGPAIFNFGTNSAAGFDPYCFELDAATPTVTNFGNCAPGDDVSVSFPFSPGAPIQIDYRGSGAGQAPCGNFNGERIEQIHQVALLSTPPLNAMHPLFTVGVQTDTGFALLEIHHDDQSQTFEARSLYRDTSVFDPAQSIECNGG